MSALRYAGLVMVVIVASVWTVGCKSDSKSMDSWMGRSKWELMREWGQPSRTESDGRGGEILIYGEQDYQNHRGPGGQRRDTSGNVGRNDRGSQDQTDRRSQDQTRSRTFWADRDGRLYKWK